MQPSKERLRRALSRSPVYVRTRDEEGLLEALEALDGREVRVWTCLDGLGGDTELRDPLRALRAVRAAKAPAVYVFADLLPFLDRPEVRRALRELRPATPPGSALVFTSPTGALPAELVGSVEELVYGPAADDVLEAVEPRFDLAHLGGLDALKAWLAHRRALFSRDALEGGLPVPRGILLMGVSGCGKSFAVKTLAKLWEVPLYRLDMNLVFSGLCGRPEAAFHRALRSIESAAPAVLWIDELEDGLSAAGPGHSQSHLFSAFLTWMQEKPPLVFVAATANRIEGLPPEVLRKGRFDEVFFLDLPSAEERAEIFTVHLQLAGIDPEGVRVDYLAADTESWTGAEIEQAVAAARVDAAAAGRAPTTEDLLAAVDRTVPLARTMHEQIRALREWARTRATPASRREGAR